MPIAAKSIPGFMVEKKPEVNQKTEYAIGSVEGHNKAIDEQGQRELGLDRDKLAKTIFKRRWPDFKWEELAQQRIGCLLDADASISKEQDLIVYKPKDLSSRQERE